MMPDPDFWDFILEGGYDLLFSEEEGRVECPSCHHEIQQNRVEWVDEDEGVLECPGCNTKIKVR